MYAEFRIKTPVWEGDIFGRLTPPPEDIIEMERGFFAFPPSILGEQLCCEQSNVEEENLLLDLEFETLCPREFNGYKCGPTLAELNDSRSRSPLINPEMKRLHRVATSDKDVDKDEAMCESASKTQSSSVLEQQLKTQQSTSLYHVENLPSYSNCSTKMSSTVTRSEAISIPNRDSRLGESVCLSPPSPQDKKHFAENVPQERKVLQDFYPTQSVQQQFVSPQFSGNYTREEIARYSAESVSKPQLIQQQETETSASHEQVSTRAAYHTEDYDESEEEDEMDSEIEDIEEEYYPFQKENKTPTRRKGRKSESEDMVPNPTKLLNIGRELEKLNKIINSLKPINEVPQQSRGRSRREKNKLASRACRLKKKQQHEANKVKLHGLQSEQENLMFIINDMKNEIVNRAHFPRKLGSPLNEKFKNMAKKVFAQQVAGHTTDFVREVLQEVARGNRTGGLILPNTGER